MTTKAKRGNIIFTPDIRESAGVLALRRVRMLGGLMSTGCQLGIGGWQRTRLVIVKSLVLWHPTIELLNCVDVRGVHFWACTVHDHRF